MPLRTFLAASAATFLALPALADGIEAHDPIFTMAFEGAPSAAVFMQLHNPGGPDDRLIAAESALGNTMLHETVTGDDGIARMEHRPDGFPLPTDGEILLQRGSYHVMIMGIDEAPASGAIVPITLIFEDAGPVVINAVVRIGAEGMATMDHDAMDDTGMDGGAGN